MSDFKSCLPGIKLKNSEVLLEVNCKEWKPIERLYAQAAMGSNFVLFYNASLFYEDLKIFEGNRVYEAYYLNGTPDTWIAMCAEIIKAYDTQSDEYLPKKLPSGRALVFDL